MNYEIKETCSCGATLTYDESVDFILESKIGEIQREFHDQHKHCLNNKPKVPEAEAGDDDQ